MEIDLKCRNCLQAIRELAVEEAEESENPLWALAYAELAGAADKLDAMEARSTVMEKYSDGIPQDIANSGMPEKPVFPSNSNCGPDCFCKKS